MRYYRVALAVPPVTSGPIITRICRSRSSLFSGALTYYLFRISISKPAAGQVVPVANCYPEQPTAYASPANGGSSRALRLQKQAGRRLANGRREEVGMGSGGKSLAH